MGDRECTCWNECSVGLTNVLPARSFQLSLLQMSDGSPHPDAVEPVIIGTEFGPWQRVHWVSIEATGRRLAADVSLVQHDNMDGMRHNNLFIWDWRTGQKYCVSRVPGFLLMIAF